MVNELNGLVADVKSGKGSLGAIITDTSFAENLNLAILRIKLVAGEADTLAKELSEVTYGLKNYINNGKVNFHALLK
jgi:phospholipid/cholesterol/gamma-HCH transport system substrate-binding protein